VLAAGYLALGSISLSMLLGSVPAFRRSFFSLFSHLHSLLALLTLGFLIMHGAYWAGGALLLWAIDSLFRKLLLAGQIPTPPALYSSAVQA
jgi:hypothetical protein